MAPQLPRAWLIARPMRRHSRSRLDHCRTWTAHLAAACPRPGCNHEPLTDPAWRRRRPFAAAMPVWQRHGGLSAVRQRRRRLPDRQRSCPGRRRTRPDRCRRLRVESHREPHRALHRQRGLGLAGQPGREPGGSPAQRTGLPRLERHGHAAARVRHPALCWPLRRSSRHLESARERLCGPASHPRQHLYHALSLLIRLKMTLIDGRKPAIDRRARQGREGLKV